ncbi:Hemin transport system permease protein HmuU [Sporomusa ovata DSM 2662]|uniref:Hemin ABC transporter, permease protein n=1 Tax=Sporomusa ovata TaxID=2378 RepID=A0A0U1L089_9FIRM|nr:iron ABC transporter permease [Sporomusa ovata]EQB27817.1 ABC-type Fe3+-siderophore transport system, permease component [Sporomusa ovata DSM 2662]CQR72749.1 Hemin ABC transporter, permease protein [Sporomusa ovata]
MNMVRYVEQDPHAMLRNGIGLAALVILLLALAAGVLLGAVPVSLQEITQSLLGDTSGDAYQIIYNIRLPRVFTGALVGMNLALAGCVLQGVLCNPLADPGIIGVSAGAGLAAMLVMILWPELTAIVPLAAFFGALAALAMVIALAWNKGVQPLPMVLAGVAVAALLGGGMSILMIFYSDKLQGTVNWMAGSLQGKSWDHIRLILPYSLLGVLGVVFSSRYLNLLQLGDEVAKSLGARVQVVRFGLIILAALLAASAVSVVGLLGFVGLIVPHITRMLIGSDFEYLMPCSALFGAVTVVAADLAARTVFRPVEIPVGIFMAFLGTPFFIYLLRKGMKR